MTGDASGTATPTIFLVGFMGCGKTTVGPRLAAQLGLPFLDLDLLIEARTSRQVHELIRSEGEEAFRQIEALTLAEAAESGPAVISLGGGAVTREENRRLLASSGLSIWLDAPFDLCWRRIRGDSLTRPLAPSEEAARERYEERRPLYRRSRLHIRIEEGRSADEIAGEIATRLSSLLPRLRESSG